MKVETIIHKDKDGGYWAEVPALPGCYTQADTLKELKYNVAEAVEGWMKVHEEKAVRKARRDSKKNVKVVTVAI